MQEVCGEDAAPYCLLNDLVQPASSWEPSIIAAQDLQTSKYGGDTRIGTNGDPVLDSCIPILVYDRFEQGQTTDRDPLDSDDRKHNFLDVVHDLHSLIPIAISHANGRQHAIPPLVPTASTKLILIGASIGAPIARLYAQMYPGTVAALIFLDSIIPNRDYSAFCPDPTGPGFKSENVTDPGYSFEDYVEARKKLAEVYARSLSNDEGLNRRTTALWLPHDDKPVLEGPGSRPPLICVVGHDPEVYAEESRQMLGIPESFTRRWTQTAWDEYNRGLLRIGDTSVFDEVEIATGCSHLIHMDRPEIAGRYMLYMLQALAERRQDPVLHAGPSGSRR